MVVFVQLLSLVQLFATPWPPACQAALSFTISQSLLKLMSIQLVMPSHPTLSLSLSSFNLSQNQGLFKWVSFFFFLCIRWPKYWSFSFSISPSNKYSELIFFRIDWFHLAVQGTLKSLLQQTTQFKSINSSALSWLYGPNLISICDYWKKQGFD